MAKISVIMPVYNTEKYLEDAILSILNQDFDDFEFIILDDFSNDNSYKICEKFAKIDKRIKLYRNEKNEGISFSRNKLISLTNTNIICNQDSDDISHKNRLSLQFDFLQKNENFAVCSSNTEIINEKWDIIWFRKYSSEIEKVILKKSPLPNWASIFRKDIFFEVWWYDKNLDYAEDYDLWLKIFSKWYKIWIINKYLYKLRIRDWQTKSRKLKNTLRNTLFVQKRAMNKYLIKAKFSDKLNYFLLNILYFLPNSLVLFLFKRLEYKNDKR